MEKIYGCDPWDKHMTREDKEDGKGQAATDRKDKAEWTKGQELRETEMLFLRYF